ncbi:TetR/AcrR family transcriptional regulator [Cupriavidus basilensis]|uniref:Transcriptional regulator, TetR family, in cluster with 2-hydroxychromene-2-carboxylate isomerase family protein, glutathione-dependent n=1 Tax=Cupriavidus basilensis TaxID=68895 RepID=A0A0C4YRH5_9BURK|nr:TetR/AcrR family transcriptional regulator [Cupriavidus basilensis]AJG23196.1 Transcriptional regulator, TetR family, in cluster with 2-hydroxychromene-2-carboxylate isomerase family protein, glutathione-dependent [Cupriavidus basilensis]
MRYSATHKAANRERVLEASGALVKREGFASTGVDQLMGAAGLTGGAFYSHFDSKQALLREGVERELQRSRELLLPDGEAAWGVMSQCVGALMLARTVANQDVAREILKGARTMLERAGGAAGDLRV